MELVFATGNINKLKEVQSLLPHTIRLLSLTDIGCTVDIPETGDTIEANAGLKAAYVFDTYGLPCFADDTGLEIDFLNGQPGVLSARYAGETKDAERNMDKVLNEMKDYTNRKARFKTVIALQTADIRISFSGLLEGTILIERRGRGGFGYDPIFLPDGTLKSLAEISLEEKNRISHRGAAVNKLVNYLKGIERAR
jgi:XTP/dITP diphosphohydrolase